ncbi:phosphatase PAP2 family protein [Speluncibacter jeojiensis]|uniref:Phosphatase PAP2 family protein n=1 Tax=Speluncibacter jeojiensis TaxID=2710754 RepID=A0A9X4M9I2_9ACTN|nr:phosphatase PAP2 family protein [Corynebacteriales bacterium D3-21]
MVNLDMSWRQGALLAGALFVAAALAGRSGRARLVASAPAVREAGVIAALFTLWQWVGALALTRSAGAVERGHAIVRAERRWLPLPAESTVQQLITPHPWLTQACNLFYATAHVTALLVLLVWLFWRRREHYARVRTTLVLVTAGCLLVALLPVAPPRLLPRSGFVDTAAQYGQSVYAALDTLSADQLSPNQLSAMPSVHVAWALLVAVGVITVGVSRWRWLVLAHPAVTVFVVVATANHYWLDGIVAAGVLALAMAVQWAGRRLIRRGRRTARQLPPAAQATIPGHGPTPSETVARVTE